MRRWLCLAATAAVALAPAGAWAAAPPPSGGSVSIEPKTANGDYDPALRAFTDAMAQALAARGFVILDDPGHAAYVAELTLSQGDVGTGLAKVPAGRAAAGPGAALGAGVGVSIPFSTGASRQVPLQRTRLDIRLRKRGEAAIVWKGAAVTIREGGTRDGADKRVAADLSEAALRSYPAEHEEVIGVP